MGRELKRVPLDFDWPLHKIWPGFDNPYYPSGECEQCHGSGDIDGAECPHCEGDGQSWKCDAIQALYKATRDGGEPPTGDGYQVWENVSEGSPISPVFATSEEIVQWLIGQGHSEAGAREFIKLGFAFSMMFSPSTGIVSGIDALGFLPPKDED